MSVHEVNAENLLEALSNESGFPQIDFFILVFEKKIWQCALRECFHTQRVRENTVSLSLDDVGSCILGQSGVVDEVCCNAVTHEVGVRCSNRGGIDVGLALLFLFCLFLLLSEVALVWVFEAGECRKR